jgi:D-amino-acid dehydrogenase
MRVLGAFGVLSRDCLDRLVSDLGSAAPGMAAGVADIWNTPRGEAEAEAETAWMQRLGFATEHLDGAALRRQDPAWGPGVRGACVHADGLSFDPAAFCDALRLCISDAGGRFRSRFKMKTLRRDSTGWTARAASGAVASGQRLIVAAGVWSAPIVAPLGVNLRIQAAKGYHVHVTLPTRPRMAGVLRERKIAVTPLGTGVRLAGTLELSGINHRLVPHRIEQLTRGAAEFLPQVGAATPTDHWCGLRPCTANGLPVVGRLPARDAWVATGHGMMGLTLAAGTAELLVSDMLGGPIPPWAQDLRPLSR